MSNSNIFYHEDNLSDTICDVSQGLKLVRAVVFEPTTDESTLTFGEREGLLSLLDSLYQALSLALGEAMDLPKVATLKNLSRLSEEQHSFLATLVEDIVDSNLDHAHLDDGSRKALACFEAKCADLTEDECVKELARMQIHVAQELSELDNDGTGNYRLSKQWTLKGLRYELARNMFVDSVMCAGADQEPWKGQYD